MTRSEPECHPSAAMDDAVASEITVMPVRARTGNPRIAGGLWAVAGLILLAIVKPWGIGAPEPDVAAARPQPPRTLAPRTPEPTEDRSADGLAAPICLGTGGWRIASLESWRTQDVRVWRAIEPAVDAGGPLDPAIPSVPIVAVTLTALGWCAPAFGSGRPIGQADVTAWYVRDGRATEVELHQVKPSNGSTPIAALYEPLTRCPEPTICVPLLPEPVAVPWSTGRVVFRYVDNGAPRALWIAADVEILGLAGGPSPTAAPPD